MIVAQLIAAHNATMECYRRYDRRASRAGATTSASRMKLRPEGLGGGASGAAGRFLVNGKTVSEARKMVMQPNDEVTLETPGGGGYGLLVG